MKESHIEGLASHDGPKSCDGNREAGHDSAQTTAGILHAVRDYPGYGPSD